MFIKRFSQLEIYKIVFFFFEFTYQRTQKLNLKSFEDPFVRNHHKYFCPTLEERNLKCKNYNKKLNSKFK